ncbi:DUF805 domain-containing protein [Shimwellia blattae]|uniref:Conserved putative membrane protein n=1 Tax=Shimwellia blattae (strain ATCC 29907 / DSM 4481 / JCM 1650 / NBRC 105725 / CDC 9005-74) TaxID=630626 RepID=I2BEE4_SHIBC|nr:DUF805 domain-containing protein [Shimwellia blattae]AFJ48898.1 conserved putative membrane protein [Shimwellia blattae DSM 4481 = NBRC 105725]GAB81830.1 hypothetical protein YiiR [Shimwellia blattae DSM 4481 = NBRC 105725]VDY66382.1 Predicted membrane protein [Shimwellia blattae]VEC28031.1 Predicted membrane protein [Shimwellia blattae]
MTLQQWLFSFRGRIGRRDFWIWIGLWLAAMVILFSLAGKAMLNMQTAAFMLVCLLWPTACVVVKRLHDRGKSGAWAFLLILAWMLLAGNWSVVGGIWEWALGRFIPVLIMVMIILDLGAFTGTQGENKYGKETTDVKFH